ncbi:COMM domain-containing protein 9 isoform X2 [Mugil cephalus]|uniref:COMM domain-containing protein 9 isoform X2 n=1 Tax=Mugil cephalus TaxID=48193 RepID=UPI001FB5FBEC|nr:COMM domain-containing protein 9 isoform X2 [Mugil cephalus]
MSTSDMLLSHDASRFTSQVTMAAAAVSSEDFTNLQLLLQAPSKDAVRDICVQSHRGPSVRLVESTAAALSIPAAQAAQVTAAPRSSRPLLHLTSRPSVFPESFHPSLKKMITKILLEHSPVWRTDAVSDHISLPQLTDLDWRVDMVTGSDSVGRMSVPTCLVRLQTQDAAAGGECVSAVTVELSRESLDTILDGLGRIRDQLSVVAGK